MKKNNALAARTDDYDSPSPPATRIKLVGGDATRPRAAKASSLDAQLGTLQTAALSLVRELKSLGIARADVDVRAGINFYDEVSRFEADLIRQALIHTDGHQVRAARLLGLGVTTLNSMIKRYGISPHHPARDEDAVSDEEISL